MNIAKKFEFSGLCVTKIQLIIGITNLKEEKAEGGFIAQNTEFR